MATASRSTIASKIDHYHKPESDGHLPHSGVAVADIPTGQEELSRTQSGTSIAILLCTKDGERFLDEQLESIHDQNLSNIALYASDDGSTDNTTDILSRHQTDWGEQHFSIRSGPQQGYAANFLSQVCNTDIQADYYAFADQDDVWEADKLSRAIEQLETTASDTPALYCARRKLIAETGADIGQTPLFRRAPSFANSLVQSLSGGNTMVFNQAARNILCQAGQPHIVSHDWWAYSLISGAGGTIFYDAHPSVRYRQHDDNVLGASPGWRASWLRVRMILKGRFQDWNAINTLALKQAQGLLTSENRQALDQYAAARARWLVPRALGVWRSGVYRQTLIGNLGLGLAVFLNKI